MFWDCQREVELRFLDEGEDKRVEQEERPLTRTNALSRLSTAYHTGQATVLGRQYSMPYRGGNGKNKVSVLQGNPKWPGREKDVNTTVHNIYRYQVYIYLLSGRGKRLVLSRSEHI